VLNSRFLLISKFGASRKEIALIAAHRKSAKRCYHVKMPMTKIVHLVFADTQYQK